MIVMKGNNHASYEIPDFKDLKFDAPLNLSLAYLQFNHRRCQFSEILGTDGRLLRLISLRVIDFLVVCQSGAISILTLKFCTFLFGNCEL